MSDTAQRLGRHAAGAACLVVAFVSLARAQSPVPAPAEAEFLSRVELHLSANSLSGDDQRFTWDAYFGGTVDVVDYVHGRASILADYHPVLGSEYRPFDPNQAYYALEASGSYRAGDFVEVAAVFHHVSRHLSDRPKPFAVAWNVMSARLLRRIEAGGVTIDLRADAGAIVQHSYVDYSWTSNAEVTIRRGLTPKVGVFAHGTGEVFGVDGTVPNRGTQNGGRLEGGVRFDGRAGALELFAGVEKRLDADPLDRVTQHWAVAGFRLMSR
jgi:hypothetical protein